MKIDFKTPITGLDGKPLGDAFTLGAICIEVLLATFQEGGQPEQLSSGAKIKNATLAQDIYRASEAKEDNTLDLSVETISILKGRIGRGCTPLVTMKSWALLDPATDG